MDASHSQLAVYLLMAILSMSVSMAIIPVMMRLAPALGMIDAPDPRKVHSVPIPRVGGLGIVIGALVPMLIWLPFNDMNLSILIGSVVLLVFGTWDDVAELGHYVKFIGQFLAAIIVVYYGDLYVSYFPLNNYETIPESIGRPFTVFAIVGMINAINHSDGLDGLAGGESLISLGAIVYLAFSFNSDLMLILALSTIGGIFGFLRYNSHPARVFMGDGGSQFLGFILAVLVVYLTQVANTTLSPAIPLLILGLPIVDILAVFYLRAKNKLNLFRATRNHIHHRLLDLGFYHYESVVFIYTVQFLLVISAIPMMYENDALIIMYYLAICASVFIFLTVSERTGVKVHQKEASKRDFVSILSHRYPSFVHYPEKLLQSGLSLFILASAVIVDDISIDFAISSIILAVILFIVLFTSMLSRQVLRLVFYITIGFSVYFFTTQPADWLTGKIDLVLIYFILMCVLAFITIKITPQQEFRATPLDYLVIAMVLVIELMPGSDSDRSQLIWMIVQIIILFYICELLLQNMKSNFNRLTGSMALALAIISYRGVTG